MSTAPPGWYDDGHGARRWWDGQRWSEHVAPADGDGDATAGATGATTAPHPEAPHPDGPGPEQKKSRLWIVWVVLGVVVVGLAVLVAILIPLMTRVVGAPSSSVVPEGPDQAAAVAAVMQYDEAWNEADCALLEEATTSRFRVEMQLDDCAEFEQQAMYLAEGTEAYEVVVTGLETLPDGSIEVATRETYVTLLDEQGEPRDTPTPEHADFVYLVVHADGAWRIDTAMIG